MAKSMTTKEFRKAVKRERERQLEKWGDQVYNDYVWLGIAVEELGEAVQAINETCQEDDILKELVQTAAVLEAWATGRSEINEKAMG